MRRLISLRTAASSFLGTVTRTISQPASSRRWIWATVASTSLVSGVVIDWTQIGLSPPTTLSPTRTSRVRCRWNVCLYAILCLVCATNRSPFAPVLGGDGLGGGDGLPCACDFHTRPGHSARPRRRPAPPSPSPPAARPRSGGEGRKNPKPWRSLPRRARHVTLYSPGTIILVPAPGNRQAGEPRRQLPRTDPPEPPRPGRCPPC